MLYLFEHSILPSSAWIGSTQVSVPVGGTSARLKLTDFRQTSLVFFPALVSGRLFDTGHLHVPLFIASVNLVLCTLLIAECHEYWHFLLCQGFGVGVGAQFLALNNCPPLTAVVCRSHAVLYMDL